MGTDASNSSSKSESFSSESESGVSKPIAPSSTIRRRTCHTSSASRARRYTFFLICLSSGTSRVGKSHTWSSASAEMFAIVSRGSNNGAATTAQLTLNPHAGFCAHKIKKQGFHDCHRALEVSDIHRKPIYRPVFWFRV